MCPTCRENLDSAPECLRCSRCEAVYPVIDNIPCFLGETDRETVRFYECWHNEPYKIYNLDGIGLPIKSHCFIRKHAAFFEKVLYTQFQRERFFKRFIKRFCNESSGARALDLGCGGGNEEFLRMGKVYGVDYCIAPMKHGIAGQKYHMIINCDCNYLPFRSNYFDYVVSSDLIGHIPPENKEKLFSEMSRVLKYGGLCAHIIETDSTNFIKSFAKKHSELYNKYFIEGIGGHWGLELPTVVLERLVKAGLQPIYVKKYYSYLWDIESCFALFNNEYKERSFLLKTIIGFYRLLCKSFPVKVMATFFIGAFSYFVDFVVPLNKAEGIMVICRKNDISQFS